GACYQCRGAGRVITSHCKTCGGQGRVEKERQLEVKIPAGVDAGARLRLAGEGGQSAGPAGDLFVGIHVKKQQSFQRQGATLYINVPITFTQAALGAEVKVPTLDGEEILPIPEGAQTGSTFRFKGKGVISLQGHGRGDLFAVVTIVTPTRLTREQKELLEE